MITSGITRKIDELGRIVLPKEIRKSLNINTGDDFQITIENNKIILNKFEKLKNIETEILKIIKSFILVYPYKIYFIIGNEEITTKFNFQYKNGSILITLTKASLDKNYILYIEELLEVIYNMKFKV